MRIKWCYFFCFWLLLFLPEPAMASDPIPSQEGGSREISEQTIQNTLKELQDFGNRTTWEKQGQVADYLYRRLKQIQGLEVRFHFYQVGGKTWKNVVARCPGTKNPKTVYLFCAHFDSHPAGLEASGSAPGADDNGSGVAVLLEGARILAKAPGHNTIEWVFFSNEEQGHLGSQAYVQDLKAKGHSITGVINVDTIGYTQSSLKALWQESQGKSLLRKVGHLVKQLLKKPVYFVQTGFKNPNEVLLVGGRPDQASFVDKITSLLKKTNVGIKKDIGPQCG
ncbi:MAG: M20/M25/M40 family metallo-hydrolase [Pseudomonadota bacterium]